MNNRRRMPSLTILQLPMIVLVKIFIFLDLSDLQNLMLTCKVLRDIVRNEGTLWKSIYRKKLVLMNHERDLNIFNWYHRCRISYNWREGKFRNRIVIKHKNKYIPWVRFIDSERLYLSTGSELSCYEVEKRILSPIKQTWSLNVPTTNRNDIRTNDITRFIIKDNTIVCGNRDGGLSIYALDRKTKWPHLIHFVKDCHQKGQVEVSAVEKISNIIITVSHDSPTVCFWQIPSHKRDMNMRKSDKTESPLYCCREIQLPDVIGCKCITVNKTEDKLAVGLNGNNLPLLIDAPTGRKISGSLAKVPSQMISDIQWHNENLVAFVTHLGRVRLFDVRQDRVVYHAADPYHARMYCLRTDSHNAMIVGTSEHGRCALFDIRYRGCQQAFFTQKERSPVYSLDFDTTKLVAAIDRGVAALNFNINATKFETFDYRSTFACHCGEMDSVIACGDIRIVRS